MDDPRLPAYLRILADLMGLKDWTIEVLPEPASDGAAAEICCVDGRKFAKVRFVRDWHERTPEDLRATCCHEMIHCHLAPLRADMERRLSPANFATADMLLEYAIDGMADAWSACLPLPPDEEPPMGRQKAKPCDTSQTMMNGKTMPAGKSMPKGGKKSKGGKKPKAK